MLGRYKPTGTDQILAEFIKAGGETSYSEIHKRINYIWNNKELPQQQDKYLFRRRVKNWL
jgi:hypothetical protein